VRPQGVIVDGWGYIIAAYTITAVLLSGYAISLILRWRSSRRRTVDPDRPTEN